MRQVDEYEPMVQREAEALAGAGFDVDVICMRYPGRPARDVVPFRMSGSIGCNT